MASVPFVSNRNLPTPSCRGPALPPRHPGEGRDPANRKRTPFAANERLIFNAASNVAKS
jgi:hypothetical protein